MGDIKRIIALSEAKERGFAIGRDDLQLATLGGSEGELAVAGVGLDGEGAGGELWPLGGGDYDGVYDAGGEGGAIEGVHNRIGAHGGVEVEEDVGVIFDLGADGGGAAGADSEIDKARGGCLARAGRIWQVDGVGHEAEDRLALARNLRFEAVAAGSYLQAAKV